MALFQHKLAGGDAASAPVVAPAAASAASLGAFKNNLNSITQSLASSIAFPGRAGVKPAAVGPQAQQEVGRKGCMDIPSQQDLIACPKLFFTSSCIFLCMHAWHRPEPIGIMVSGRRQNLWNPDLNPPFSLHAPPRTSPESPKCHLLRCRPSSHASPGLPQATPGRVPRGCP